MVRGVTGCPILVERDAELDALGRIADDVVAGTPAVVLVTGEAGGGKTRLSTEFLRGLGGGWRRVVIRATSPWPGPFADLVGAVPASDEPHVAVGAALAGALRPADGLPVAVLIDDAHVLDPTGIAAFGPAIDALDGERVLIVATFRLDAHRAGSPPARWLAELRRHPNVSEVRLRPLSRATAIR